MYVKSVAVAAQVLCIVSFGPLADSRKLITYGDLKSEDQLMSYSILAKAVAPDFRLHRLDSLFDDTPIPLYSSYGHPAPHCLIDDHWECYLRD